VPLFIYDNTETTHVEITPPKANKIIEAIAPNTLAGIKVSFVAYDKLLGYVFQLPKSVGVFPGGIFSLYSGYSVGVRGAIHPPSTPFPEACVQMYEALKIGNLQEAQKQHDLLAAVLQVVGRFLRTHGRGVFAELMRMRGLPVERFPRWETAPFTEKDRSDLKESLQRTGIRL
jgi:dihydrodipicolinate synthase/N-acetylneuraminate lyase